MIAIASWTLCLAGFLSFLLWNLISFVRNLLAAWLTGLPCIWVPVNELNAAWMLTTPLRRSLLPFLPASLLSRWSWIRLSDVNWHFAAKFSHHARLGDVFLVVSPGGLNVEIADAQAAIDIMTRSKGGFVKPAFIYGA